MAGRTTTETLKARFERERFAFDNDDGSRLLIGEAETDDERSVTIRGKVIGNELNRGITYTFYGKWTDHEKYGRQFAFTGFSMERPVTKEGVVSYLSNNCHGIGRQLASKIWDAFGDKCLTVLEQTPEVAIEKVSGFTQRIADTTKEVLKAHGADAQVRGELLELLGRRGFRRETIDKLIEAHGDRAPALIRSNPYMLLPYKGAGFLAVDRLYLDLKLDPTALVRQKYCGLHAMTQEADGSTWHKTASFYRAIISQISGADAKPEEALRSGVDSGDVIVRGDYVSIRSHGRAEEICADALASLLAESDEPVAWPDVEKMDLYPHQREQLRLATRGRVGILAGSPGSGKSHTLAELIKAILNSNTSRDQIASGAPTGKAAVRISEAMNNAGVPLTATTIHSLLGVITADGGSWAFTFGHGVHFDRLFIFIDESSMIDTQLFSNLITAVGPKAHILFVGDPNQLPPVGHGCPLLDMIDSDVVPCGTLTEIHRNSGRIVKACAEIRDHRRFSPSPDGKFDIENGENLVHIEAGTHDDQINFLRNFFAACKRQDPELLAKLGLDSIDPIRDVQVIVPVNKKSPIGRVSLNTMLQGILNVTPDDGSRFSVGDKVINLKNADYMLHDDFDAPRPRVRTVKKMKDDPEDKSSDKIRVANGEQGEVLEILNGRLIVRTAVSGQRVKVLRKKPEPERPQAGGNDDSESEDQGTGCNWDLAYAISCHKCVHPNTIVETTRGLQRIKDIPGEGVIGTPFGAKQYINKVVNPVSAGYRLVTNDGYSVSVTPEHKVEVWRDGMPTMLLASDVKVGDVMRLRIGPTVACQSEELAKLPAPPVNMDVRAAIHRIPVEVNESVAEWLGLFVADGTVFRSGFRLVKRHAEVVERFAELCHEIFGVEARQVQILGTGGVEVCSVQLAQWIRSIDGLSPNQKFVPECILASPLEVQKKFLRGLFEDGWVNLNRRGKFDHIGWSSSSPEMVETVRVMLLRMGIVTGTTAKLHDEAVYIYAKYALRFAHQVGFITHAKQSRALMALDCEPRYSFIPMSQSELSEDWYVSSSSPSQRQYDRKQRQVSRTTCQKLAKKVVPDYLIDRQNYHFVRLMAVTVEQFPSMCVEVPEGHQFLQNGFPHGNSQGDQFKVVIVMIDDHAGAKRLCNVQWIYTAISRAKHACITVGKRSNVNEMCRRSGTRRKTFLREMLVEKLAGENELRRVEEMNDIADWFEGVGV